MGGCERTQCTPPGYGPECQGVSRVYEDYNALKDFVSAFPVPPLSLSNVHFHLRLSASSMGVYTNFTTFTTSLQR